MNMKMANMKRYYIANEAGRVEEMWFNNDNEAFTYAVERNKKKYENWKAYDQRGDLIFGVAICR